MISAIAGIVATGVAVVTLLLVWDQRKKAERQRTDDEMWAAKFDKVAALCGRLNATAINGAGYFRCAFVAVFSDPALRHRIRTHIVQMQECDSVGIDILPVSPEQLRSHAIRETIQMTLDAVEAFKRDNQDKAREWGF